MSGFDFSKIPNKEWTYSDEKWEYGIVLEPKGGVIFWGESHDGDDAGSYRMSFKEFLKTKNFSEPIEIIEEIRLILKEAKI